MRRVFHPADHQKRFTAGKIAAQIVLLSHISGMMCAMPSRADEVSFDMTGRIAISGEYAGLSATALTPDPAASGDQDISAGGVGVVGARLKSGGLALHTQLRIEARAREINVSMDEAWGELLFGEALFVHAGRRILSHGQAYGLNPADVLYDRLKAHTVYPASQSRSDSRGIDLVGAQMLFDSGSGVSLIYAPGHRNPRLEAKENFAMLRFSGFAMDNALDYSLALLGGRRPGAALSLSGGIGDASVLYMDATIRKGREKQVINGIDRQGGLLVSSRQMKGIYPFVTLGLGHTFENGLSVNVEATHDAGGYSGREWDRLTQTLNAITPARSAADGRSLRRMNNVLNHYILRRNYGFVRLARDTFPGLPLSGELTALYGIDDGSGSLGLRVETPVSDQVMTGLYARYSFGGANDEFTLRPRIGSIALYSTIRF